MGREARLNAAAAGGGGHINHKRARIQEWMMSAGWRINDAQSLGINTAWVIGGLHASQINVAVAQPAPHPDLLAIEAGVTVTEDVRKQFEAMSVSDKNEMLWDLKKGLLFMSLEFNGLGEPLGLIRISQFIYDDGLTKDAFLNRLHRVKDGAFFVLASIGRRFGGPLQENWDESLNVH